jgi:hypothetical protein
MGICGKLDGSMKTGLAKGHAQKNDWKGVNHMVTTHEQNFKIGRVP